MVAVVVVAVEILIGLLIVGGVVLVVLTRTDLMAPAPPDEPAGLPPGPVTPADLAAVRLPVALFGYRRADVDELLDRLGAELHRRAATTPGAPGASTSASMSGELSASPSASGMMDESSVVETRKRCTDGGHEAADG